MNKDDGGPAFPLMMPTARQRIYSEGMTLRDYFAAKALRGWLANPTATPVEAGINDADPQEMAQVGAVFAYTVADAMLAERNK